MTTERIFLLHRRRPFQPFTIHVGDGSSIVVKSPEFLVAPPRARMIEAYTGDGERVEYIDLLLVTRLSTAAR